MDPGTDQDTELLTELRRRRAELTGSMSAVDDALATRAGMDAVDWAEQVRAAVVELAGDFDDHLAITEGPEGLYRELEQHAVRLAGPIRVLTLEHVQIGRRIQALLSSVDPEATAPYGQIRRLGTELLVSLRHHRRRGADVVFAAYAVDIGGET